ncbi:hypothetical protein Bmyc01_45960 [Bacillus mycoides]|uniref:hypothetical protein n=1 Tax=Bacillus TaxID=1386 RepID=UPI0008FE866B|nr:MULTISPECIES: hypothetical protein [Bacillus]MED1512655.1 hypothetical protein [Bacillus proteolyticus]OJD69960.1 hypothetical protein BAU27_27800 [Bacillus sp. NH11B]GLV65927.1 hypothetical protein Bmyc01_45960 [Bacillus mycoides]
MIQSNEWFDKEAALLSHLILTLIRSPHLKNLIYDNEEIPNMIAYSIIKELNGDIEIESELGKGTHFSITIPC